MRVQDIVLKCVITIEVILYKYSRRTMRCANGYTIAYMPTLPGCKQAAPAEYTHKVFADNSPHAHELVPWNAAASIAISTPCGLQPQTADAAARCTSAVCACQPDDCQGEASLCAIVAQWPRRSKPCGLQMPFRCSQWSPHDFRRPRRNRRSHIDASHSRQPLIKGERSVRYEVNTVILEHCLQLCKSSANKVEGKGTRDATS